MGRLTDSFVKKEQVNNSKVNVTTCRISHYTADYADYTLRQLFTMKIIPV